jgi:lipopolysaccharide/colanic/teichoic acid biosynthesis glycosyltransferase
MALVNQSYAPLWKGLALDSMRAGSYCPVPIDQGPYFKAKRWLDLTLGSILLIMSLPLLAILVVAVRLSSRGPALYCQKRVGLGGRVFTMYKLRSMSVDAETATGPRWASAGNDPRVTPLGYWLRRLHLDELPQLVNLVRGDMSLVGPRPERPEFVPILAEQIPGYVHRLQVMPGITGLAQVNLPPDTDLNAVRRKLALDLEYVRSASLHLDLRVIGCTALRLIGIDGVSSVALFGLRRASQIATDHSALTCDAPVTPQTLAEQPKDAIVAADQSEEGYELAEKPAASGSLAAARS